jgi:hypothetical protein
MLAFFHHSATTLLYLLIFGHFVADYPLQGPYLSEAKNPDSALGQNGVWKHALFAHAYIQSGFVLLFTGSLHCAVIELVAHAFIDYGKCKKYITYNTDQALHIACKVLYLFVVFGQL